MQYLYRYHWAGTVAMHASIVNFESDFDKYLRQTHSVESGMKETTASRTSVSYLDLLLSIERLTFPILLDKKGYTPFKT